MKQLKRTKRIRLLLIGGISAGALAGCSPADKPAITPENVYPNNYYVPGVGYYHAPFNAWYPIPYNHFDPAARRYYFGGSWGDAPFESIVNISSPAPQAANRAEASRTDIARGGFGSTSGCHYYGGHYYGGHYWGGS